MAGILQYALSLNTASFTTSMATAQAAMRGMGTASAGASNTLANLAVPTAATAGIGVLGAAAIAAGVSILGLGASFAKAVSRASEMETLQTAFIPLLGSASAAKERIADLAKFAADTPFEMPEVAVASRTLETLTRGALSTGEGLRLVGDVASGTGSSFGDIAVTIGRLYDGLDSGRPVGEAMARLQELGAVSGSVRGQLENLQATGAKGAEVWAVAAKELSRFSGSMELQSKTWGGLLSTLSDNIGQAFAAFGAPLLDTFKPILADIVAGTSGFASAAAGFGSQSAEIISLLGSGFSSIFQIFRGESSSSFSEILQSGLQTTKQLAEKFAYAAGFIKTAFTSGDLGSLVGLTLEIGIKSAINTLYKGLVATLQGAGQLLVENAKTMVVYLQILSTPDFWKGMGNALSGIFLSAVSLMSRGLATAMELLRPIANLFGDAGGFALDAAQQEFRAGAKAIQDDAAQMFTQSGDQLAASGEYAAANIVRAGESVGSTIRSAFSSTKNLFDTSSTQGLLAEIISSVQSKTPKVQDFKPAWKPELMGPPKSAMNATTTAAVLSKSELDKIAQQGNASRQWQLEDDVLTARAGHHKRAIKSAEDALKLEKSKLEIMTQQGLSEDAALEKAKARLSLEDKAAGKKPRGLLDAAASAVQRLARRSPADVAKDARMGHDGLAQADRLGLQQAGKLGDGLSKAKLLNPKRAADALAKANEKANPGAAKREADAAAAKAAEAKAQNDPLYKLVSSINERFKNLAPA